MRRGWLGRFAVVACALLGGIGRVAAQRELVDIPPPDPEEERATFEVAEGFEVNLYAADPRIAKPIQMNFDPAGRLWIASSEVYPQIRPGQEATDKILVLDDADADGVAERVTVFADGLLIPTGVEPGDGGAYVANSTELLHFRDTDGDGRADERRIVLSGFGTEDTHHILHTLRWGPEGLLYFNQSIYIHSHIETPHGVRRLGGGGIWHFRPETMELDVFCRGFVNPWGHHFDAWGQSFATDGAFGEGINYVFPGATFCTAPGAERILSGLNPGSPKHCGLEIVGGSHLPDDWQGNMITNDFRAHRVCRFVVKEDRDAYSSREATELIKTAHVAFRPIDVKMGPDGAIYIADWYNPIIQHGEVDFRDPRRDHTHGRIWRVTAKGRPLASRPTLVGASTAELLAHVASNEPWARQQAKRVLKERAREVLPEVAAWIASQGEGETAERNRLEGLWIYQALDVVEPELLDRLSGSADPRVRAAAMRVVYHWQSRLADPLALLARGVDDEHPRVRLEAVRALSRIPKRAAAELAMRALRHEPLDPNLDFALWQTCRDLQSQWLPGLSSGEFDFGGDARSVEFAVAATNNPAGLPALVGLLQKGAVRSDRELPVLTLIARLGDAEQMAMVLQTAVLQGDADPARQASLLAVLAGAARQRRLRPAGDLGAVASLLESNDPQVRVAAAQAIGAWRVESARDALMALARKSGVDAATRSAALASLSELGGGASIAALDALCDEPEIRLAAIRALASLDASRAAKKAVARLSESPHEAEVAEILEAFQARQGGAARLAEALSGQRLAPDTAKLALRAARRSAQPSTALVDALRAAGGLSASPAPPSAEELSRLVAEVVQQGDPHRGEAIFRRRELTCLKCHAIAGAGGQVGPDLLSIGASAQIDYLVESLLAPNKAIKENYHTLVVTTDDGRAITGVKLRQTDTQLILRDADDREVAIPLDAIEEQAPGASLMPAGLAEDLTRSELVDLARFLSELGKPGPFAVGSARVVRRWQALAPTEETLEEIGAGRLHAASTDNHLPWTNVPSTVAGTLPIEDLPRLNIYGTAPVSLARFQLRATQDGPVTLRLGSSKGLTLLVDGAARAIEEATTFDLAKGDHTIGLVVNLNQRVGEPLRVELLEGAAEAAPGELVGGK